MVTSSVFVYRSGGGTKKILFSFGDVIRAILVDDEPKARETLKWELQQYCPEVEVLTGLGDAQSAMEFLRKDEEGVDLVFLDVHMPRMTGLEWLEQWGPRDFEVIIVSAHDEHIFDSMKHEVFDYLVKPIETLALKDSIKRLEHKLLKSSMVHKLEAKLSSMMAERQVKGKVHFNLGHQQLFVNLDEVIYLKAEGNYCELKLLDGSTYLLSHLLRDAVKYLDGRFFRVHNSYVVNLDRIRLYDKKSVYLEMEEGSRVPISRRRKVTFLNKI